MAKLNWRIVDRYFAGEATAAERALVEQWLAQSPAFRMFVNEIYRGTMDEEAIRRAQIEVAARFERDIAHAARSARRRRAARSLSRLIGSRSRPVLAAAAVVAVLVGAGLLVWQLTDVTKSVMLDGAVRSITAAPGQPRAFSLPDGSQVILSPGSTARYAAAFSKLRREVRLEGEAYFDVHHDAQRPFVVRAGDLVVEDLGTQFVVRAYPEDTYGRVVVREGLVGLAGATVSPGEMGRLSPTGQPVVKTVDVTSWFAWTQGRLVFDGMPLREALPKLSRWYDLEFRLADPSLGDRVLVATLPERKAEEALDVIALALRLRVVREGRIVTFYLIPPVPPLPP